MDTIFSFIYEPWPWYVVGPLMGATIPILLFSGNKMLGASSSLRHICALLPNKLDYFQYDIKKGFWNLFFAGGVLLGASLTYHFLYEAEAVNIAHSTRQDLLELGIYNIEGLMPAEIFSSQHLWSLRGLSFSVIGGFLVGFGVRYAGGCTSGHGFMGLSQMSLSSAIAIISFFVGGTLFTHFILPVIL